MAFMSPDPDFDFNPQHLPKAYLEAIGLATAAASFTEYAMETALTGFLRLDVHTGGALTANMNAPTRDNALRAIGKLRLSEADQARLEDLLDAIKSAHNRRNAIVHHTWAIHKQTGQVFRVDINAHNDQSHHRHRVDLAALQEDAAQIHRVGRELLEFVRQKGLLPRD